MTPEQLERLTDREAAQRAGIVTRLITALWNLWRPFGGWYDDDRVAGHAARSANLVDAAALQTYMLAREYIRTSALLDGRDVRLPPVQHAPDARTGVTPTEVYTRPAEQYRFRRSQGEPDDVAVDAALERLAATSDLDLGSVRRQGLDDALRATGFDRYRRVIHPERSRGGTCGLCIAASTRVYTVGELLPIHGDCRCGVAGIPKGGPDPAELLNGLDLRDLYAAAGSTGAEDLANTRWRVTQHDELGPILELASNRESAAHREAREAKQRRRVETPGENQWRAERRALEERSARLAERVAGGDDSVRQALAWQRDRIALLTSKINAA